MKRHEDRQEEEEAPEVTAQGSAPLAAAFARGRGERSARPRVVRSWEVVHHWVLANTFAPSRLTGRWSHPAFGYLVAVLLQAVAVAGTALLVQLVPSFHFIAAPLLLVVLLVALGWGAGPSLGATLVGLLLLLALAMSPSFELAIAHRADVLDILMYLVIGATSSLLAGAVASARERAMTVQREAERARQHLHDLFMQAPTPIVLLRKPEHRLELVNPLSRIAGKRDVVGKTLREVLPEDESHGVLHLVDQVYTTGTALSVEELRVPGDQRGDGSREEQYFNVVYQPIRTTSGEVDGIMILSVDVTEQVRARQRVKELVTQLEREKEALRVSEERARMISELTADHAYVYRLQPDGTLVREWTTSAFTRMNCSAPEELDAYDWESAVHPDDRPLVAARIATVGAGNPDVREWRVLTRSGEVRWLRDYCRPIIDQQSDRLIRIYGAAQDITERKETEQQKDDFISIAAHELRTPIAIVRGFAHTLLVQTARGKGPPLAAWQEKALAGLDLATQRLSAFADDLLDMARLQAGQLELRGEPTDLVALAQRVVTRQQLTTEHHTLALVPAVERLVAQVDPRRMEQALSNLVGNAIKYSPDGGPIEVTIRADAGTPTALLSVRDHGIGIPARQQAHLFGRFVQADNARASGIAGTGLGLYLCRELVERHGGQIWCESVEGQGSTFFMRLPLASPAAPARL
jgi:PAS domain S-box-containing protein